MKAFWRCFLLPGECLVLAREKRQFIPIRTIAFRARMSVEKVWSIARKKSWDDVTIKEANLYISACGINPYNMKRQVAYLKRALATPNGFKHLRALPKDKRKRLAKLL